MWASQLLMTHEHKGLATPVIYTPFQEQTYEFNIMSFLKKREI
jgi:hypothetical protein